MKLIKLDADNKTSFLLDIDPLQKLVTSPDDLKKSRLTFDDRDNHRNAMIVSGFLIRLEKLHKICENNLTAEPHSDEFMNFLKTKLSL